MFTKNINRAPLTRALIITVIAVMVLTGFTLQGGMTRVHAASSEENLTLTSHTAGWVTSSNAIVTDSKGSTHGGGHFHKFAIDGEVSYCLDAGKAARNGHKYKRGKNIPVKALRYVLYLGYPNNGTDVGGVHFANDSEGKAKARRATQLAVWIIRSNYSWKAKGKGDVGEKIAKAANGLVKQVKSCIDKNKAPWADKYKDPNYRLPSSITYTGSEAQIKIGSDYWTRSKAMKLKLPEDYLPPKQTNITARIEGLEISSSPTDPNAKISWDSIYKNNSTFYAWLKLKKLPDDVKNEATGQRTVSRWRGEGNGRVDFQGEYVYTSGLAYRESNIYQALSGGEQDMLVSFDPVKTTDGKRLFESIPIVLVDDRVEETVKPYNRITRPIIDKDLDVEVIKDTVKRTSSVLTSEVDDNVEADEFTYEVNFRNRSNTKVTEFTLEDNLEMVNTQGFRVEGIWTPKVWGNLPDYKSSDHSDTTVKGSISPESGDVQDLGESADARITSGANGSPYSEYAKLYIKVKDANGNYVSSQPARSVLSWKQEWTGGKVSSYDPNEIGTVTAPSITAAGFEYDVIDGPITSDQAITFTKAEAVSGSGIDEEQIDPADLEADDVQLQDINSAIGSKTAGLYPITITEPNGNSVTVKVALVSALDADPVNMNEDSGPMDAGQKNRANADIAQQRSSAGWNFAAYIKSDEPHYFPVNEGKSGLKGINLNKGEYISAIRIDYGAVDIGFTSLNKKITDINDGEVHDWAPKLADSWFDSTNEYNRYKWQTYTGGQALVFDSTDTAAIKNHVAKVTAAADLQGLKYIVKGTSTIMNEVSADGTSMTDPTIKNSAYAYVADASKDVSRSMPVTGAANETLEYADGVKGKILSAEDNDKVITRVVPTTEVPTPFTQRTPESTSFGAFTAMMREGVDTAYMVAAGSIEGGPVKKVNGQDEITLKKMYEGFTYSVDQELKSDSGYVNKFMFHDRIDDCLEVIATRILSDGVDITSEGAFTVNVAENNVTAVASADALDSNSLYDHTYRLEIDVKVKEGLSVKELKTHKGCDGKEHFRGNVYNFPNVADTTVGNRLMPTEEVKVKVKPNTEISKDDITNGKELPGATLVIKDEDGKTVDKWVSTNKPHYLHLDEGKYTLTEITAPDGYEVAESIDFTVEDGKAITKCKMHDKPKPVIARILDNIKTGEGGIGAILIGLALVAAAITAAIIYRRKKKSAVNIRKASAPLAVALAILIAGSAIAVPSAFADTDDNTAAPDTVAEPNTEEKADNPVKLTGIQKTFYFTAKGKDVSKYIPEIPSEYAFTAADFGGELPDALEGQNFTLQADSVSTPYPYTKIHDKRYYTLNITDIADSVAGLDDTLETTKPALATIAQDLTKEGMVYEDIETTYSGIFVKDADSEVKTNIAIIQEEVITDSGIESRANEDVNGLPETKTVDAKSAGHLVDKNGNGIDGWAPLSDIPDNVLQEYTSDSGIMYKPEKTTLKRQHITVKPKNYSSEWIAPPKAWEKKDDFVGLESYLDISNSLVTADYSAEFVSEDANTWLYAVTATYLPDRFINVSREVLDKIGESTWRNPYEGSIEDILTDIPLTEQELTHMQDELVFYDQAIGLEPYKPEPVDVGSPDDTDELSDGSDLPDGIEDPEDPEDTTDSGAVAP